MEPTHILIAPSQVCQWDQFWSIWPYAFSTKGTWTEEQEYKILCEYVLLRGLHYMLVITLHVQLTNNKDYSC